MAPLLGVDGLRSSVPSGAKFPGAGRWRVVGRLADVVEALSVDVFGGPEGVRSFVPDILLTAVKGKVGGIQ
jgi:hypothetical protein